MQWISWFWTAVFEEGMPNFFRQLFLPVCKRKCVCSSQPMFLALCACRDCLGEAFAHVTTGLRVVMKVVAKRRLVKGSQGEEWTIVFTPFVLGGEELYADFGVCSAAMKRFVIGLIGVLVTKTPDNYGNDFECHAFRHDTDIAEHGHTHSLFAMMFAVALLVDATDDLQRTAVLETLSSFGPHFPCGLSLSETLARFSAFSRKSLGSRQL